MERFKKFLLDYKSITSWAAKGAILAPFLAVVFDVGPPWPSIKTISVLTSLIQLFSLMYAFTLWEKIRRPRLRTLFKVNLAIFAGSIIIYMMLFQVFTKPSGSETDREAIGFIVQKPIQAILAPDFTIDQAFEGVGYDPTLIWEPWTVYLMRLLLLTTWMLVFISIALSIGSFSLIQSRQVPASRATLRPPTA